MIVALMTSQWRRKASRHFWIKTFGWAFICIWISMASNMAAGMEVLSALSGGLIFALLKTPFYAVYEKAFHWYFPHEYPKAEPLEHQEIDLMHTTLVPAYGRDYKSAKEVKEAWEQGHDFIIANLQDTDDGRPINKEQAEGRSFNIRYCRLTKIITVKG